MKIDDLIKALQKEKEKGAKEVNFFLDGGGFYAGLKCLDISSEYDSMDTTASFVFRPRPKAEYSAIHVCNFWKIVEGD